MLDRAAAWHPRGHLAPFGYQLRTQDLRPSLPARRALPSAVIAERLRGECTGRLPYSCR
jgi:hypothetical protein